MGQSCQEIATVLETIPPGRALVRIRRAEACHSCAARGACQTLGGQTQDIELTVDNSLGAVPGDQVVLSLDESAVIKASAVLYLVPATTLILGALVGAAAGPRLGFAQDPGSIWGALGGLCLGLVLVKLIGKAMSRESQYIPRLTAVKDRAAGEGPRE